MVLPNHMALSPINGATAGIQKYLPYTPVAAPNLIFPNSGFCGYNGAYRRLATMRDLELILFPSHPMPCSDRGFVCHVETLDLWIPNV